MPFHTHTEKCVPRQLEEVGDMGSTQIEKLSNPEQTSNDRNHWVNVE